MENDKDQGAAVRSEAVADKWHWCPECGSEECTPTGYDNGKYCSDCGQEWFPDLDYSDVVRKHLTEFKSRTAKVSARAADALDSQPTSFDLESSEQYRLQMAAISGAALGYTKLAAVKPEYMTQTLRDVDALYEKYAALHAAATQPTVAAQQGSIADDARFRAGVVELLGAYDLGGSDELGTGSKLDEAFSRLTSYIDSRASSARGLENS